MHAEQQIASGERDARDELGRVPGAPARAARRSRA